MNEIDGLVSRIRRKVEKALPWFDPDQYKQEAKRQEEVIVEAEVSVKLGKSTLEAYKRAHELRR